ncbi:MAG: hypothetical protein RXO36_04630 [Candidatus Nanopusillus acidilobi]
MTNEADILLKTFNKSLKKSCSSKRIQDKETINNLISKIPEYYKEKAINLIKSLSPALIDIYKEYGKEMFYEAIQSLVSLFNNELLINKDKGYGIDTKELKPNYNLTDLVNSLLDILDYSSLFNDSNAEIGFNVKEEVCNKCYAEIRFWTNAPGLSILVWSKEINDKDSLVINTREEWLFDWFSPRYIDKNIYGGAMKELNISTTDAKEIIKLACKKSIENLNKLK